MNVPHTPRPSPAPGEGAERRRREAGEGLPQTKTSRARSLRANMTDAERKLWLALRDRRLDDAKVRRQVPIGPYIADFACYAARLVIEIDGGQHAESKTDERRDHWFAANEFRVLRFWNNEVLENIEGVLTVIVDAVRGPEEALTPAARCAVDPLPERE